MKKIESVYLDYFNNIDISTYLGEWYTNIENLKESFLNAKPFEHIIIKDFLNKSYAENIYEKFPDKYDDWYKYCNPLEVKYAFDDINHLEPNIKDLFYILSTNQMVDKISQLTDIKNLTYDDYLHGAGLHAHPRYGRLNMHLDYEKHPYSGKQRRLNIILYMNKKWNPLWNGATELWDENMSNCIVKSDVNFNTAIIFKTNEISWHGVPEIIMCPETEYRKSIAYYYVSPLENLSKTIKIGDDGSGYRTKATFVKRPDDIEDERVNQLFKIRPYRRIEKEDMNKIWPDWEQKI